MNTIAKCAGALGLAAIAAVGIGAGTAFADTTPNDQSQILQLHNQYRAEVGTAPLQWDTSLQASAQQWADHLMANPDLLEQGANPHDPSIQGQIGENIYNDESSATGMPATTLTAASAPRSWYSEKAGLGGTTRRWCGRALSGSAAASPHRT